MSSWSEGSAIATSSLPTLRVIPRSISALFCSFVPQLHVIQFDQVSALFR